MATYTELDERSIQACLDLTALGTLKSFRKPNHGIENTNYLLEVEDNNGKPVSCVLTIYEGLSKHQIRIYTACLKQWGRILPVPLPLQDEPKSVPNFPEKDFVIASKLEGEHLLQPSVDQCAQMGHFLAHFHCTALNTPLTLTNPRGIPWALAYEPSALLCTAPDRALFKQCQHAIQHLPKQLKICPQGWIHADLFPDNALFIHDKLCGVIDFNNACTDNFLLDLCITLNAWSSLGIDASCDARFSAMLNAYTAVRPLTEVEQQHLHATLLAAAIRFWASRIDFVRETGGKHGKEPEEYRRIAESHLSQIRS
ncbi:MAG: phosphotransferase [Gammaproteobacteria bacterium]